MSSRRVRPHPVKLLLDKRGQKIVWLAQRTGYNADHLGRVINGLTPPSPRLMAAVAMALDTDVSELFRQGTEVAR